MRFHDKTPNKNFLDRVSIIDMLHILQEIIYTRNTKSNELGLFKKSKWLGLNSIETAKKDHQPCIILEKENNCFLFNK